MSISRHVMYVLQVYANSKDEIFIILGRISLFYYCILFSFCSNFFVWVELLKLLKIHTFLYRSCNEVDVVIGIKTRLSWVLASAIIMCAHINNQRLPWYPHIFTYAFIVSARTLTLSVGAGAPQDYGNDVRDKTKPFIGLQRRNNYHHTWREVRWRTGFVPTIR